MKHYWIESENGSLQNRHTGLDCYWHWLAQSEVCERCGVIVPIGARGYYFAYVPYALPSQCVCEECMPKPRREEAREA